MLEAIKIMKQEIRLAINWKIVVHADNKRLVKMINMTQRKAIDFSQESGDFIWMIVKTVKEIKKKTKEIKVEHIFGHLKQIDTLKENQGWWLMIEFDKRAKEKIMQRE